MKSDMLNEKLRKDRRSSIKWSAIDGFFSQALQFIIIIILARLLTPNDFGLVGVVSIVPLIANAFIDGGMSSALIRKGYFNNRLASTVFYFNIIMALFIFSIVFFLADDISIYMGKPIIKTMLEVSSFIVIFSALEMMQRVKLTLELNFRTQAIITIFSILISGITGIILALLGFGVWALVSQQFINAILRVVFSFLLVKWLPLKVFDTHELKELFGFGSKLLVSNLLDVGFNYIYILLINKHYGIHKVGIFTQSKRLSEVPAITISTIIRRVNYPLICKLKNNGINYINEFYKTLNSVSFVVFPLFIFVFYISPNMINLVLGDKWLGMIDSYKILLISFSFYPINSLLTNVLQLEGRSDLYLYSKIINKIFLFSFLMVSITLGFKYIFYGILLTTISEFIINGIFTSISSDIRKNKILQSVIPYFIASILSTLILTLIDLNIKYVSIDILVSFIIYIVIYILLAMPIKIFNIKKINNGKYEKYTKY